jgi:hypothetical protein
VGAQGGATLDAQAQAPRPAAGRDPAAPTPARTARALPLGAAPPAPWRPVPRPPAPHPDFSRPRRWSHLHCRARRLRARRRAAAPVADKAPVGTTRVTVPAAPQAQALGAPPNASGIAPPLAAAAQTVPPPPASSTPGAPRGRAPGARDCAPAPAAPRGGGTVEAALPGVARRGRSISGTCFLAPLTLMGSLGLSQRLGRCLSLCDRFGRCLTDFGDRNGSAKGAGGGLRAAPVQQGTLACGRML